jgi:predicted outer membrane repeat protein
VFKNNYAYEEGGAISSSDVSDHSMYLTNCYFVSNSTNTTDGGGGAICMAWDIAYEQFNDPDTSISEADVRAYLVENAIEQPVSDALPGGCTP